MRNFFKNFRNTIGLGLILFLATLGSLANAETKAAEFKSQVGLMVYSLENIQNGTIIQDLDQLDTAAGSALTYELAAEISVRFETALELARHIIEDSSMTQDQKREVLEPLVGSLAQLFETVAVQSGDDTIDPLSHARGAMIKLSFGTLKEFKNTILDIFSFPRGQKVFSIEEQQQLLQQNRTGDEPELVQGKGQRVWKVKERMIRDLLLQELSIMYQKAVKSLGEIEGERADNFFRMVLANKPEDRDDQWAEMGSAQRMEIVRTERRLAHRTALGLVVGIGVFCTVFPWDFVGTAIGRDYYIATGDLSRIIGYSGLVLAGLIKQATSAFASVPILKDLVTIVENPNDQTKIISELRQPFMTRLLRIKSKMDKAKERVKGNSAIMCTRAMNGAN